MVLFSLCSGLEMNGGSLNSLCCIFVLDNVVEYSWYNGAYIIIFK